MDINYMAFVKHFCRLITTHELNNRDVNDFFDIVQSVVSTKMVASYSTDGEYVIADVIAYVSSNEQNVYEIILDEEIDQAEGDQISQLLLEQFSDIDFEFEASVEA
jgi:hypothetical protein